MNKEKSFSLGRVVKKQRIFCVFFYLAQEQHFRFILIFLLSTNLNEIQQVIPETEVQPAFKGQKEAQVMSDLLEFKAFKV